MYNSTYVKIVSIVSAVITLLREKSFASFPLPSSLLVGRPRALAVFLAPRLLIVNETGLLKLQASLGPAGNRYALEHISINSLQEGAKLVACEVVRTRRRGGRSGGGGGGGGGGGSRSLGMVCVAMLAPPLTASAAETTAAGNASGTSGTSGGVLSVFTMGGEKSFEVERALQRHPQQQLLLPYAPQGMAHTTVWRSVAALPNFVGGGLGEEGPDASSLSSPISSPRRVERGDAVLVWDQDGAVHSYTRWHSSVGRGGGSGGGAAVRTSVLKAESRESLRAMIPELRGIDGPVSCLAFDAMEEDGEGTASWRRRVLAGCKDTDRCISVDDVASDRKETAVASVAASVAAPVSAVAFNARTRFFPQDRGVEDVWGGDVLGFACNELDLLAWLVRGLNNEDCGASGGGNGTGGSIQEPRWLTGTLPLPGAGGDQVECIACADFCRDGSTSVAVGTRLGKVIVYGAEASGDERRRPATGGLEEIGWGDGEGLAFGLGTFDDDDSEDESAPSEAAQSHSRRWDSTSPRPSAPAAAPPPPTERQHQARRGADRAGAAGGGGAANGGSSSRNPRPLLSVRWQRDVPHGVLKIAWGDFNHDGVSEMVVATRYGVHVFRPDYLNEANRFAKTMHALKTLQPKDGGEGEESDGDSFGGGYGVL